MGDVTKVEVKPAEGEQLSSALENNDNEKLLAGKYKTTEDLEKGYKELEAKLGQNSNLIKTPASNEEQDKNKPDPTKDKNSQEEMDKQAQDAVNKAGLDFGALSQEFEETGELSEESYNKLGAIGVPKEYVDAYIAGQKVLVERDTHEIYSLAGGEKSYVDLVLWAKQNWGEAEVNAYDKMITSPDMAERKLAVTSLKASYEKANGSSPQLILGGSGSGVSASGGFATKGEMTTAIKDPRYKTDAAYREEVAKKISQSSFM